MEATDFGARLAYLRKEARLTQEELAEKIGVSRQTVTRWETGETIPALDALINLAAAFAISLNELVYGQNGEELAASEGTMSETEPPRSAAKGKHFKARATIKIVVLTVLITICAFIACFSCVLAAGISGTENMGFLFTFYPLYWTVVIATIFILLGAGLISVLIATVVLILKDRHDP